MPDAARIQSLRRRSASSAVYITAVVILVCVGMAPALLFMLAVAEIAP